MYSGPKKNFSVNTKVIHHQNMSSYNSPSSGSRVGRAGGTSERGRQLALGERAQELSGPATLGQVADVGGS